MKVLRKNQIKAPKDLIHTKVHTERLADENIT